MATHEDYQKQANARVTESLKRYWNKINANICPYCNRAIIKRQNNRCVVASPCGHTLYQGTLSKE